MSASSGTEAALSSGRSVAFWLRSFDADGAISSTLRLATALVRQGVQVDLMVSKNAGVLRESIGDPIRIVDLGLKSGSYGMGLISAGRYVLRERPHAVCAPEGAGHLLAAVARAAGAQTSFWVWARHTRLDAHMARKSRGRGKPIVLLRRLRRHAARPFYALSARLARDLIDGIIVNSQAVGEELRLRGCVNEGTVHVLYNPAVTDEIFKIADDIQPSRLADKDQPIILSVGRLRRQKDFDALIRAFHIVRSRRPARLIILGEGKERPALERLVRDLRLSAHVTMPGFTADPVTYLARADVFVLSSQYEPFGNVLVEAMACGCAVVSTDCTGPREILGWGRYGRLVPVGDYKALAEAVLATLEDPPNPSMLQARARDFHVDRIAAEYRRVLAV